MTVTLYCLGKQKAQCVHCYSCNQTPQEYVECPHFVGMARHEFVVEESIELNENSNGIKGTLEDYQKGINLWATRTGMEETE